MAKNLVKAQAAKEIAQADSLLGDVRNAEGRAERLYGAAEGILDRALEAEDLKTALNAIRAAVDVMGEARQYLELRGELTGELNDRSQQPLAVLSVLMLPLTQRQSDPASESGGKIVDAPEDPAAKI